MVAMFHGADDRDAITRMAKQEGVDVEIRQGAIERQCEHEYYEPAIEEVEWAEAVLSIACGAGT